MTHKTFVGLHIPKCAGMSILHMAHNSLPAHQFFQNTSIIKNWRDRRPEFLDIYDHSALRFVWGHSVHEQMLYFLNNPILFTGLREPVQRLISAARYQVHLAELQGRPFDVNEWLLRQRNPMTSFIIHRFPTLAERDNASLTPFERAKRALQAFHHVYFTDTFDESVKTIFDALGVEVPSMRSNVSPKPDLAVEIDAANLQYDIELYEWAREEFGHRPFDPDRPASDRLAEFLSRSPQPSVLENFLFNSQAGEYTGWKVLDEVIEDRIARATRLLKEAEVYRRRRNL